MKTKVPNHIVSLTRNCIVKIPSGRSTAATKFHFRLTLSTNILSSKNPTCYSVLMLNVEPNSSGKNPKNLDHLFKQPTITIQVPFDIIISNYVRNTTSITCILVFLSIAYYFSKRISTKWLQDHFFKISYLCIIPWNNWITNSYFCLTKVVTSV